MKPSVHAIISAKRYGGKPDDYIEIHNFIDSPKAAYCDVRQRALLHNSFGCYLVEKVFGVDFLNSDGKMVSTRDVAEHHIQEDLGFIPTVEAWLKEIPLKPWMDGRGKRNKQHIKGVDHD